MKYDRCNICGAVREFEKPCNNCETKIQNKIADYLNKFYLIELANKIRSGEWLNSSNLEKSCQHNNTSIRNFRCFAMSDFDNCLYCQNCKKHIHKKK